MTSQYPKIIKVCNSCFKISNRGFYFYGICNNCMCKNTKSIFLRLSLKKLRRFAKFFNVNILTTDNKEKLAFLISQAYLKFLLSTIKTITQYSTTQSRGLSNEYMSFTQLLKILLKPPLYRGLSN